MGCIAARAQSDPTCYRAFLIPEKHSKNDECRKINQDESANYYAPQGISKGIRKAFLTSTLLDIASIKVFNFHNHHQLALPRWHTYDTFRHKGHNGVPAWLPTCFLLCCSTTIQQHPESLPSARVSKERKGKTALLEKTRMAACPPGVAQVQNYYPRS